MQIAVLSTKRSYCKMVFDQQNQLFCVLLVNDTLANNALYYSRGGAILISYEKNLRKVNVIMESVDIRERVPFRFPWKISYVFSSYEKAVREWSSCVNSSMVSPVRMLWIEMPPSYPGKEGEWQMQVSCSSVMKYLYLWL